MWKKLELLCREHSRGVSVDCCFGTMQQSNVAIVFVVVNINHVVVESPRQNGGKLDWLLGGKFCLVKLIATNWRERGRSPSPKLRLSLQLFS